MSGLERHDDNDYSELADDFYLLPGRPRASKQGHDRLEEDERVLLVIHANRMKHCALTRLKNVSVEGFRETE